jgi:hypothetical protein
MIGVAGSFFIGGGSVAMPWVEEGSDWLKRRPLAIS